MKLKIIKVKKPISDDWVSFVVCQKMFAKLASTHRHYLIKGNGYHYFNHPEKLEHFAFIKSIYFFRRKASFNAFIDVACFTDESLW